MSSPAATIERVGLRAGFAHSMIIARRNLLHIKSDPEQLVGMTVQPLMFLMLFVFVLGGAIAGSSQQYLQFALPGIMVQGIAFTGFQTALGINNDFNRGLIDRFRSLPISRSAVVGGRILADAVRVMWGTLIITGFGLLLGFRFHAGLAAAVASLLLVIAFGITVCWPMALIGSVAHSPEAVNTWGFLIILPLTFASSVFAPPQSMPGWLQAFVKVNPITFVVDATRGMMLGGPVASPLLKAILWMIGLTAVFAPLAVDRYRKRI
ncbi:MAG: ABC transporter permease [Actinomycetota bacterium]|nr:ABC transporter permease [Actinomycetota bacterium]